jgi:Cu/Ag efflux protein CusF
MRFFSTVALIISLVSLGLAFNGAKRLNDVKKGFQRTMNELSEVRDEFAAHQQSQWPKFYEVNGKLLFKPGGNRLIIDHEEIPNVMPAMIMSYEVEDPKQIERLEPGDRVHFRLKETADKLFIVNIEKAK